MDLTATSTKGLPTIKGVLGETALPGYPLANGLTAFVIARPGDALTRTVHSRIYEALVPVTSKSFGADMTPYWAQRAREGYLERLAEFALVAADDNGAICGWTGYHRLIFDDLTIIYLDSTGVIPDWQSRGCMRTLMQILVRSALTGCPENRPVHLTARTESPIFYRLMRSLVNPRDLFPQPASGPPPDVVRSAVALAKWLGQEPLLDASSLILRGAYDALDELYGDLPVTGDPVLDDMFRKQLGPLDAYLLIGRA